MLGIFLDIETNGLDPFIHCPLEISLVIKGLTTKKEVANYTSFIIPSEDEWQKSSPQSLKFTEISLKMLKKSGKEKTDVKDEIIHLFKKNNISRENSVFICQNPSFDRPFFSKIIDVQTQENLNLPYHWLDLASMYLSKRLIKSNLNYTLALSKDAIANDLGIVSEEKPHRAKNGVDHLISCYMAVTQP